MAHLQKRGKRVSNIKKGNKSNKYLSCPCLVSVPPISANQVCTALLQLLQVTKAIIDEKIQIKQLHFLSIVGCCYHGRKKFETYATATNS